MKSVLSSIEKILLSLFFLLYPIFFLNFTFEPAENSKLILLIIFVLVLLIIKSIKLTSSRKLVFITSTYLLPILLITFIYIISNLISSPNKILPLISPLSTSSWVFLLIFYISVISFDLKTKLLFLNYSIIGGLLVGIFILAMYFNLLPQNVVTPAGNLHTTAIFLLALLIYTITSFKKNILFILSILVFTGALGILVFHLATDQKPLLLPNKTGYFIFSKIATNPQSFFLGVGPSNFIMAFTLEKPAEINKTPLANITFTSSSSFFTNILAETGILTGISFISLVIISLISFIRSLSGEKRNIIPPLLSLIILGLLLFLFPGSTSLLILFVSLLGAASIPKTIKTINLDKIGRVLYFFPLTTLVIAAFIGFLAMRAYVAEYYYYKGSQFLYQNDLTSSYNTQKQAIIINPLLDKYHLAISQTSLLIANELLKKEDKTETEIQNTPKLISQAIEEGRIAVNLNKTNVLNWANLTKIYSALITFAPGAESWALEIARQTIALDPNNPIHYYQMGLIQTKLKDSDGAKENFEKALAFYSDSSKEYKALKEELDKIN